MHLKFLLAALMLLSTMQCHSQDVDAVLEFKEITVIFKGMAIDGQSLITKSNDVNSKSFNAWIGYKLTPGLIHIQSDHVKNITVKERFETSVTLMNDGQHCDLTDWEHYVSPWKPLRRLTEGDYQGISLPFHDRKTQRFPNVTKEQLIQQVAKHCGAESTALLTDYKNVFTPPCAVAVSEIYLSITGQDTRTGNAITSNVLINVPMGD